MGEGGGNGIELLRLLRRGEPAERKGQVQVSLTLTRNKQFAPPAMRRTSPWQKLERACYFKGEYLRQGTLQDLSCSFSMLGNRLGALREC